MIILSLDPGKNNFAFSVCEITKTSFSVIEAGLIKNTVKDLTGNVLDQSKRFKKEVKAILKKHKVEIVIAERYMNRGRTFGNSGELLNIMLGILTSIVPDLRLITAAQWKNSFNKKFDLKDLYKKTSVVSHILDAILIGIYGSGFYLEIKHFDNVKLQKLINI